MKSGSQRAAISAASRMLFSSWPKIWMPVGRSSGAKSIFDRLFCRTMASDDTNSLTSTSAP